MTIDGTRIFVKKIPLTDLERKAENTFSTANLFHLPLFYQYGIGSAGFGAWREVDAHVMTTDWVLAQKCPNFPILYHWRVLHNSGANLVQSKEPEDIASAAKFWDDSPAVRNRLKALHSASAHVVL